MTGAFLVVDVAVGMRCCIWAVLLGDRGRSAGEKGWMTLILFPGQGWFLNLGMSAFIWCVLHLFILPFFKSNSC